MACLSGTAEAIKKAGGANLAAARTDCLKGWLEMDLTVYSTPANPLTEVCLPADLYCVC